MKRTEKYNLPQWELSDRIQMEDFNAMTAKLDTALTAKAEKDALTALTSRVGTLESGALRCKAGSYTGTGTSGADHPVTLQFDFTPKLVIVTAGENCSSANLNLGAVFIAGQAGSYGFGNLSSSGARVKLVVQWPSKGVAWYAPYQANVYNGDENQLNEDGVAYHYFAIG